MRCEFVPAVSSADTCKKCGKDFGSHQKKRVGRARKLSPEQEAELVRWALERKNFKAKAVELGICVNTMYGILRREGVYLHRRSKP